MAWGAAFLLMLAILIVNIGARVWLRWEPGRDEVLHRLLPIEGIELFARRDNLWYRPGRSLPAFTIPPETQGPALEAAAYETSAGAT